MRRLVKKEDEIAAIWMDINSLVLWNRNPRKNDKTVKKVIQSIKRFGFGSPILARKSNNEVIAGHTRIKAAKELGITRIPVRFMDLSEEEAHLFSLADNKIAELSEWDNPGLEDIMSGYLQEDLEIAGWNKADLGIDNMEVNIAGDDSSKIIAGYVVLIECKDEDEQIDIITECQNRGWNCRALT